MSDAELGGGEVEGRAPGEMLPVAVGILATGTGLLVLWVALRPHLGNVAWGGWLAEVLVTLGLAGVVVGAWTTVTECLGRRGLSVPPHTHFVADTHLRLEVEGERVRRSISLGNRAVIVWLGGTLVAILEAWLLGGGHGQVPTHGPASWLFYILLLLALGGFVTWITAGVRWGVARVRSALVVAGSYVSHVWRLVSSWRRGEAAE